MTETPARVVRLDVGGGVATITLDRPQARNAINAQVRDELPIVVRAAEADSDVRVIVLRGAGERAFCAGADITEFQPSESLVATRAAREAAVWMDVLAAARKPTMAAIHGFCLGGGLELALACDLRICADNATFGLPEVSLGMIPGAGGTQRLPRVVGAGQAMRLTLTAERIGAAEARAIGLVSEVVALTDFDDRVREYANRIAAHAPLALAYAKEAIKHGFELPLTDGLRLERDLATLLTSTQDRVEGTTAFRERRAPNYRGR